MCTLRNASHCLRTWVWSGGGRLTWGPLIPPLLDTCHAGEVAREAQAGGRMLMQEFCCQRHQTSDTAPALYSPPQQISRFKFIMTENSQHSQTWHISREERRMEIIYYDNKQKQCSRSQLSQISVNSHLCTSATFTLHSLLLILCIMIIWRLLAKIVRYLEQFVEE